MAAVKAVIPFLPGASSAAPVMKRMRKFISAELVCFRSMAGLSVSAANAETAKRMAKIRNNITFLFRFRLGGEGGDDSAVFGEIFFGHGLHVFGGDGFVEGEEFVDGFGRAGQGDEWG